MTIFLLFLSIPIAFALHSYSAPAPGIVDILPDESERSPIPLPQLTEDLKEEPVNLDIVSGHTEENKPTTTPNPRRKEPVRREPVLVNFAPDRNIEREFGLKFLPYPLFLEEHKIRHKRSVPVHEQGPFMDRRPRPQTTFKERGRKAHSNEFPFMQRPTPTPEPKFLEFVRKVHDYPPRDMLQATILLQHRGKARTRLESTVRNHIHQNEFLERVRRVLQHSEEIGDKPGQPYFLNRGEQESGEKPQLGFPFLLDRDETDESLEWVDYHQPKTVIADRKRKVVEFPIPALQLPPLQTSEKFLEHVRRVLERQRAANLERADIDSSPKRSERRHMGECRLAATDRENSRLSPKSFTE